MIASVRPEEQPRPGRASRRARECRCRRGRPVPSSRSRARRPDVTCDGRAPELRHQLLALVRVRRRQVDVLAGQHLIARLAARDRSTHLEPHAVDAPERAQPGLEAARDRVTEDRDGRVSTPEHLGRHVASRALGLPELARARRRAPDREAPAEVARRRDGPDRRSHQDRRDRRDGDRERDPPRSARRPEPPTVSDRLLDEVDRRGSRRRR